MTDSELLRLAIAASPEDMGVRLALADLLDRTGDCDDRDRARFIRVQIAGSKSYTDGRFLDDMHRYNMGRWQMREVNPHIFVPEEQGGDMVRLGWNRGFVECLNISFSHYLRCFPQVHRWVPICALNLRGCVPPVLATLLEQERPILERCLTCVSASGSADFAVLTDMLAKNGYSKVKVQR